jgi:predicted esterase
VHLIHGRDDDVIPWSESQSLARVLASHTNVETSITGLYGHTGAGARPGLAEMTREVATMLGMVRELATLGGA